MGLVHNDPRFHYRFTTWCGNPEQRHDVKPFTYENHTWALPTKIMSGMPLSCHPAPPSESFLPENFRSQLFSSSPFFHPLVTETKITSLFYFTLVVTSNFTTTFHRSFGPGGPLIFREKNLRAVKAVKSDGIWGWGLWYPTSASVESTGPENLSSDSS